MNAALDLVGGVFLVIGALLILLAAVGVTRFTDIFSRMHAAAKAPVLGIMFVGVGAVMMVRTTSVAISIGLIVVLQLIAGPVGAHVLGRSVYYRSRGRMDAVDELAAANAAESESAPEPESESEPPDQ